MRCPVCDAQRIDHEVELDHHKSFGKRVRCFYKVVYTHGHTKEEIHEHNPKIVVEIWKCSRKHRFRIVRTSSCGCGFNVEQPEQSVEILPRPTRSRSDYVVDGVDLTRLD